MGRAVSSDLRRQLPRLMGSSLGMGRIAAAHDDTGEQESLPRDGEFLGKYGFCGAVSQGWLWAGAGAGPNWGLVYQVPSDGRLVTPFSEESGDKTLV